MNTPSVLIRVVAIVVFFWTFAWSPPQAVSSHASDGRLIGESGTGGDVPVRLFLASLAPVDRDAGDAHGAATPPDPLSGRASNQSKASSENRIEGFLGRTQLRLAMLQQQMNRELSRLIREMRENPWGRGFWLFLFLSGGYGVVHALGPGHGKMLVASYFLGDRGRLGYAHGFAVSMMAASAHVASGVVLVLACSALLLPLSGSLDLSGRMLSRLGGSVIALVGVVIAVRSIQSLRNPMPAQSDTCSRSCTPSTPPKLKTGLGIALASGAAPCPVAAMVMAFSLSSGLPLAGSLAMVAMALGMGLTTWLFAVMAIACRDGIRRFCHGPRLQRVSDILSVCSGFMLLALGGLMLLA
ncbi:MAG: hypothetical protein Q7J24_16095 [Desulfomicrobium sp.]|nr:hypothetical protein [Desulfomicrobium sp.]